MDDRVLVGVDFTADRLRLMLTDLFGDPVHQGEWPLPALDTEEAWAWEVGGRIARIFAEEGNGRSAFAIAVAAPGHVDPVNGRILHAAGQDAWDGLSVVDALRRHIDAPIAAESRVTAALLGETWQGAAGGIDNVLYVSLRGVPQAAILSGGRSVRGAHFSAGALPALPELPAQTSIANEEIERVAGLLADATALIDPDMLVLYALPQHLDRLIPLLQGVLQKVAPGVRVARSALGHQAALVGAIRIASTLAYEGHRKP
jgi:predicted NBD/HSP70 family sugar kinase